MNKFLYLLFTMTVFLSCEHNHNTKREIYQNKRNKIVNVHDKIKEIKIENVLIGSIAKPYSIGEYLMIMDVKSHDKLIHVFDKKHYKYITSFGNQGQGPSEITTIGHIGVNEKKREIYVSDHGKHCIHCYNIDSVITNPYYPPKTKLKIKDREFPDKFYYVNDSVSFARIINVNSNNGFNQSIAKWNMNTGEIIPMKYTHPDIKRKRVVFSVSLKDNIYVECYRHHDLMTICNLDGDLKYNIYGSKWDNKTSNEHRYYSSVIFAQDKIIATYSNGRDNFEKQSRPTTLLVFDLKGNYLKTIEIGYNILEFCYDDENNRLVIVFDDEIQFGYLNLDGIV